MKLRAGDRAPSFKALNQDGDRKSLSDYAGGWLLLYFYPRDYTSGCTTEACSFRDSFEKFKGKAQVVGVSGDSVKSHKGFSQKHSLPFDLLADPEKKLIRLYGADGLIFTKRTTFLIDGDGVIRKIYEKVKPKEHIKTVLQDIDDMVAP